MREGLATRAAPQAVVLLLALAACGGVPRPPVPPDVRSRVTGVELSALEIRADDVDRFEHCPPPGEIGQDWLPPIPEWHAPAASISAAMPAGASGAATDESLAVEDVPRAPATVAAMVDQAYMQTRRGFRRCYHRGLLYDPTEDGHAAFVLRVDRTGHVARVEVWGACDLAHEALVCMRDEAAQVKLAPPAAGSATVMVPAVFTQGDDRPHSRNDGYAAAAYVAVESTRPSLHRCEQAARRNGESVFATALMTIDVDAEGQGAHVSVDQWKGSQDLLACAAQALRDAAYPPPPAGRGRVVVPVVFNPRPFTR